MDGGGWWAAVHRVAESDMTEATYHACMHWRRKWQPTSVFLPGESQEQGSLVGCRLWGHTSQTLLKWLSSSSSICISEVIDIFPWNLGPSSASSNLPFHMMYSASKLNKQGDNIDPWCTPFPIWDQSVLPCLVLTVASWPAYRFLRSQVRWPGISSSLRISLSLLWSTQSKKIFITQIITVITHLETDILECEVKWALGSIITNKASGGERIPVELFQILKMIQWKCCPHYTSKFGKLNSGHGSEKGPFSIQSQRKAMPKNAQTTTQLHSSHTLVQ